MTHTNTKKLHKHAAPILIVAAFSFFVGVFFAHGLYNSSAFAAVFSTRFMSARVLPSEPASTTTDPGLNDNLNSSTNKTASNTVETVGNLNTTKSDAWNSNLPDQVAPAAKK